MFEYKNCVIVVMDIKKLSRGAYVFLYANDKVAHTSSVCSTLSNSFPIVAIG